MDYILRFWRLVSGRFHVLAIRRDQPKTKTIQEIPSKVQYIGTTEGWHDFEWETSTTHQTQIKYDYESTLIDGFRIDSYVLFDQRVDFNLN